MSEPKRSVWEEPGVLDAPEQGTAAQEQQVVQDEPAPQPSIWQDIEQRDGQRAAVIRGFFADADPKKVDRLARIRELARVTRSPVELVESQFDEFERTAAQAQLDPEKWTRDNPHLADLLFEHQDLAGVVVGDQKVTWLGKTLGAITRAIGYVQSVQPTFIGSELSGEQQIAAADESLAKVAANPPTRETFLPAPKKVATVRDPLADQPGLTRFAGIFTREYAQNAKGLEANEAGWDALVAASTGDAEKEHRALARAMDIKRLQVQRDYDANWFEQTAADVGQLLPSQVQSLVGGGAGGAGGAALGAGVGYLVGGPQGAREGARVGWNLGRDAAAFGVTLRTEAGGHYVDLQDARTDDGQRISKELAVGASVFYGAVAAALEVESLHTFLPQFGRLGEAAAKGSTRELKQAALRELLRDKGLREVLTQAGKKWLAAAHGEGKEEVLQDLAQGVITYLARSAQAGTFQEVKGESLALAAQGAGDTYTSTFRGTAGLGATPLAARALGATYRASQEQVAAQQVATLAGLGDAPTVRAAPQVVAELIKRTTEESGDPVTHVYVDPGAFTRLFQQAGADPAEAADALMGEGGARHLQVAQAAGTRLEVPLGLYLEKWGTTPVARALGSATAASEKGPTVAEALQEDSQTQPGYATAREQRERQAEFEAEAKRIADEFRQGEQAPAPATDAEERFAESAKRALIAAGMKERDAEAQVVLRREFIRVQGVRWAQEHGGDPAEWTESLFLHDTHELEVRGTPGAQPAGTGAAPATAAPDANADTSFDFGDELATAAEDGGDPAAISPEALNRARALAARTQDPERRQQAEAFIAYAAGETDKRPAIAADLERELGDLGVVDPVHGFTFQEDGRDMARTFVGRKSFGGDAGELTRIRDINREGNEAGIGRKSGRLATAKKFEQGAHPDVPAASLHLARRLATLSPEERAREFYLDPVTGLRNRRAFDALPAPEGKQVAIITTPDIKGINDSPDGGHDTANALLRVIGHAVGGVQPEAARSGTNFFVYVDGQADLDALLAAARGALPDARLHVAGALGPTLDGAFQALDAHVAKEREAGRLPARGGLADGVQVAQLALPEDGPRASATVPPALVERVRGLTDEAYFREAYLDPRMPGALTREGWEATPRRAHVASLDGRLIREINEKFGKERGDAVLAALAREAMEAGGADVDFAHLSGDEFAAQHDDKGVLRDFLARLGQAAQDVVVKAPLRASGEMVRVPVAFRYGIGEKTYGEADRALNRAKRAPEGAADPDVGGTGEDAARGLRAGDGVRAGQAGVPAARGVARLQRWPGDARGVTRLEQGPAAEVRVSRVPATDSPAFRRWFAGSKVVDERGKPRRMFHVTREQFEAFHPSTRSGRLIYLASSEEGARRGAGLVGRKAKDARVVELYVRAERPYNTEDAPLPWYEAEALGGHFGGDWLKENGFDSVWVKDEAGVSLAVVAPGQVKSAVANRGTFDPNSTSILEQPAFHGTPHKGIDRFRLDRIGTGEGNKAFGWGLYFAGDRSVAEKYRAGLSERPRVLVDGKASDALGGQEAALVRRIEELIDGTDGTDGWALEDAIEVVQGRARNDAASAERALAGTVERLRAEGREADAVQWARDGEARMAELRGAAEWAASLTPERLTVQEGGALHQVEVPDSDVLLDYDRPLREQPAKVLEALDASGLLPGAPRAASLWRERASLLERGADATPEEVRAMGERFAEVEREFYAANGQALEQRGVDFYRALADELGGDRQASEALREAGIPGLRYLDGKSRDAGEGSHNFVIWSEDAIQMLERFEQGEQDGGNEDTARGFVEIAGRAGRRMFRVVLNPKADMSTFLHESGHVFLEMLGDLAARPDAPESVRRDWQTTLAFLGVEKREDIKTEHHEKLARGFEAWLMEGKAPSAALVRAFQRFKLWLRRVYRSVKALDVELSDDIRGVFERLFATDEEIDRARRAAGAQPLFRSPEEAGMTPEQWAAYLASQERSVTQAAEATERRALKDRLRETEAWFKEELARLRAQAGADYDAQPAARAWALLTRPPEGEERLFLDRDALDAMLGAEAADKRWKRVARKEGGVHPDFLAEAVGLETGSELLDALKALPERKAWVEETAQARMREAHPDVLEERSTLQAAAQKALHNAHTVDWLLRELEALRQKANVSVENPETGTRVQVPRERVGLKPAPVESIRRAAEMLAAERSLRDLSPARALTTERQKGEQALRAVAKGDVRLAYTLQQQRLLAHFLYGELVKAQEEREAFETLLEKMAGKKRREQMGKAGAVFLGTSDALLDALGVKLPLEDTDAAEGLDALLARFQAEGLTPAFDVDAVRRVLGQKRQAVKGNPKPWRDLSLADMRQVERALTQLFKAARDSNQATLDGQRVDVGELAARIEEEASRLPDKGPAGLADEASAPRGWWMKQRLQGLNAAMTDPELMLERLGPTAHRFFWGGYLAQRQAEDALAEKVLKFFAEKWDALPEAMQARRYELVDASGLPIPQETGLSGEARSRQWMWMVFLNRGNQGNLDRLLGGYGWEQHQVDAFLAKNMTKEEADFLQGVFDLLDAELWPEVARVYEAVNGLKPPKVEALRIKLPFGEYRGGYFPAKYARAASRVGRMQEEGAVASLFSDPSVRASVARGFTKERAKTFSDPIDLNWSVIPSHLANVVHYVAFDGFVREAARVLLNPATDATIKQRLGVKYQAQLEAWLKVVATAQQDAVPEALAEVVRALGGLRSRFVVASIGASLSVAAGDLTNPLVAVASGHVKSRYMVPALTGSVTAFPSMRRAALERSPELRHRAESAAHLLRMELGEVGKQGKKTRRERALERARELAFVFMEWTDRLTSTIVWDGAHRQALAEGLGDAQAVEQADKTVRDLFPAKALAELPALLRDKRNMGALLTFFGFFSKMYQVNRRIWHDTYVEWAEAEGAGEKARVVPTALHAAGRTLAVLFVTGVLSEFLSGRGPDDDESAGEWLLRKMLAAPFSMVPLLGFVGEAAVNIGTDLLFHGQVKGRPLSARAAPATAVVQRVFESVVRAFETDQPSDAALAGLEALAVAFGLPANQPRKTLGYLVDVIEGDEVPSDPADFASGLIYGKRARQPANPASVVSDAVSGP